MAEFLRAMGEVGHSVTAPVLLVVGVGFLLRRFMRIDTETLTTLNFHFVIPAMVYVLLLSSDLSGRDVRLTLGVSLAATLAWGAAAYALALLCRSPRSMRGPVVMAMMFVNCGNVGIPVLELAFRGTPAQDRVVGVQIFVILVQNVLTFTLGTALVSARRSRRVLGAASQMLRFPPLYAIAAALVTIAVADALGGSADAAGRALRPAWDAVLYIKDAYIAIALITLGAQLADVRSERREGPVWWSVALRLLAGPSITLAAVSAAGVQGWLAQVLVIGGAVPAGVNAALLAVKYRRHAGYLTRVVVLTTVLCPLTITATIVLARALFPMQE